MSKIYTSADQLIGNTPLLELTHIEQTENLQAKILAKLQSTPNIVSVQNYFKAPPMPNTFPTRYLPFKMVPRGRAR